MHDPGREPSCSDSWGRVAPSLAAEPAVSTWPPACGGDWDRTGDVPL